MKLDLLERLLERRASGATTALATAIASGRQALVAADGIADGDLPLDGDALAAVRAALADGRPRSVETDDGRVFVEVWGPPLRLVLVGAVHIAQALVPIAGAVGFRTVVVDPRSAFASADRFPGVDIDGAWPDEALARLRPDARTAVVALTHDPRIDDPALLASLRSAAFYVGALGSRRTHEARRARLAAAGLEPARIDRIHAPVGLAIGAATPAEIAVAIMAEIVATLRGGRVASSTP